MDNFFNDDPLGLSLITIIGVLLGVILKMLFEPILKGKVGKNSLNIILKLYAPIAIMLVLLVFVMIHIRSVYSQIQKVNEKVVQVTDADVDFPYEYINDPKSYKGTPYVYLKDLIKMAKQRILVYGISNARITHNSNVSETLNSQRRFDYLIEIENKVKDSSIEYKRVMLLPRSLFNLNDTVAKKDSLLAYLGEKTYQHLLRIKNIPREALKTSIKAIPDRDNINPTTTFLIVDDNYVALQAISGERDKQFYTVGFLIIKDFDHKIVEHADSTIKCNGRGRLRVFL